MKTQEMPGAGSRPPDDQQARLMAMFLMSPEEYRDHLKGLAHGLLDVAEAELDVAEYAAKVKAGRGVVGVRPWAFPIVKAALGLLAAVATAKGALWEAVKTQMSVLGISVGFEPSDLGEYDALLRGLELAEAFSSPVGSGEEGKCSTSCPDCGASFPTGTAT